MLEALRSAIDAADWPRALEAALEAWRALRAPELADLVEALGVRCVVLPLPERSAQRYAWWIEHAARYEPAAVTYLASQAHQGADASEVTKPAIRARWGDANPLIAALLAGSPKWFDAGSPCSRLNAVDRLAAVLAGRRTRAPRRCSPPRSRPPRWRPGARCSIHVSSVHYALFVEGLTRLPRHLGFEGSAAIELLGAHAGALSVETVSYSHHGRARHRPLESLPFSAAVAALAKLVPELEILALEDGCPPDQVDALLPQLPRMFRRPRRVEVPQAFLHGPRYRETLARWRSLPFVKIIWARGSGPPS